MQQFKEAVKPVMLDLAAIVAALNSYRARLKERGQVLKGAAVEHCIAIIRRL